MERLPQHLLLRAWRTFATGELKSSTIRQYKYWLNVFASDREIDLHDATNDDINEWLGSIGGRSKEQAKRAIRHFYRWMRGTGRILENPADFIPRYRITRPLPEYFTRDELSRFLVFAARLNEHWAWEFLFIYASGARVGEACSVLLSDLDLEGGKVVFRESKNGRDEAVNLGTSGMIAVYALMAARSNGRLQLLSATPSAVRARMKKICRLARIPETKAHPHVLRHTCGTLLAEAMWLRYGTVDKTAIQNHLRHVDPGMTDWYAAVTDPRAKATAEMVDLRAKVAAELTDPRAKETAELVAPTASFDGAPIVVLPSPALQSS